MTAQPQLCGRLMYNILIAGHAGPGGVPLQPAAPLAHRRQVEGLHTLKPTEAMPDTSHVAATSFTDGAICMCNATRQ